MGSEFNLFTLQVVVDATAPTAEAEDVQAVAAVDDDDGLEQLHAVALTDADVEYRW